MKPMKIFIFSLALCLMACAVSADDGIDNYQGGIIKGDVYGGKIFGDEDNWGAIPAPNVPHHENTHTHGLDIKPRVNEAHEVDIESHMMQLRNEASGIQKEAPQIHVEDIIHEIEPPEDEGVTLVITFDNTPSSALATEHLQTQLEILGAC